MVIRGGHARCKSGRGMNEGRWSSTMTASGWRGLDRAGSANRHLEQRTFHRHVYQFSSRSPINRVKPAMPMLLSGCWRILSWHEYSLPLPANCNGNAARALYQRASCREGGGACGNEPGGWGERPRARGFPGIETLLALDPRESQPSTLNRNR